MAYRIAALLITFSVAGGCARAVDDFIVPAGHPANPSARPGVSLSASAALENELKDVKPKASPSGGSQTPAPPSGGHHHGQHGQ